nr:immunoglobulin light chain junction region [Macaca mulatta]MOV65978.1 immunoglobulin light chain junction region [Macaca mulatta]MOV66232.1 immunoglobulin light chain junction region [Macaca mulatta]MOV66304.1 immunoglobulin light chain junction region [Macaca mulatta]MOV66591.1 immunoglobulin light chain junction region [Macaca mulatta]
DYYCQVWDSSSKWVF